MVFPSVWCLEEIMAIQSPAKNGLLTQCMYTHLLHLEMSLWTHLTEKNRKRLMNFCIVPVELTKSFIENNKIHMREYQWPYSFNGLFELLTLFLAFLGLDENIHIWYNCYTCCFYFCAFPFLWIKCLKKQCQKHMFDVFGITRQEVQRYITTTLTYVYTNA